MSAGLRIGSLFSGIGGLELGLEQAGVGHTVFQVEQSAFCRRVLARHWPDAERFEDVRTVGPELPPVDVLCGGFPCQDLSSAGKQAGLAGERSGLWWEFARLIRETATPYVVIENVAGLFADSTPTLVPAGLDWLGDRPTRPLHGAGGAVLWTLAALGFDAVWDHIPASAVGAPHQRDRVFLVAYARRGAVQRQRMPALLAGAQAAAGRAGHQRQRDGDPVGCGGSAVADPDRGCGPGIAAGSRGHLADRTATGRHQGDHRAGNRGHVADANSHRRHQGGGLPALGTADLRDAFWGDWQSAIQAARARNVWPMGESIGVRPQGQQHPGATTGTAQRPGRAGSARPPATALGRAADGLPTRVDFPTCRSSDAERGGRGDLFAVAAGRPLAHASHPGGQRPRRAWERDEPRVGPKGPHWKPRLQALGNAVVPLCGFVAGRVLLDIHAQLQAEGAA